MPETTAHQHAAAVREAVENGGFIAPGTVFHCHLIDDGDTTHRLMVAGCRIYDIDSGLEVVRDEIVTTAITAAANTQGVPRDAAAAARSGVRTCVDALRNIVVELHPAKPQPWSSCESRDANIAQRLRRIAADLDPAGGGRA